MELIKNLPTKKSKNGRIESWGLFLCLFCLQEVERKLNDGRRQKSCGCKKNELQANSLRGRKRTEEFKLKVSIGNKGKKKSEEHKKKIAESHKGLKQTEEARQKISKFFTGKKNPKMAEFQKAYWTEERKKERSKLYKGKFSGELSSSWQGGKSFEEYGIEFNKELKQAIKNRDFNICQTPNCMNTNCLDVHHIDYNKQNNNPENLIILCKSCHMKTNVEKNRSYFTEFYTNIATLYL